MIEIVQGNICDYYGDTKSINGLGGGHRRKSARMSADRSKGRFASRCNAGDA